MEKRLLLRVGIVLSILVLALVGLRFEKQINAFLRPSGKGSSVPEVTTPTIINGELVLPKVATNLGKNSEGQLRVDSANLIPIFDSQTQKLVGLQILGEMTNITQKLVTGISPLLKFYDKDGKVLGQKIADTTAGFNFFPLRPTETSLYYVTINNPPTSDKLEIILNSAGATQSAGLEELKISDQNIEVKTATYHSNKSNTSDISNNSNSSNSSNSSGSGEATQSGGLASPSGGPVGSEGQQIDQIEYYTVAGSVFNTFSDPITEITIYAWVKDENGHVFSFGRQDFKNDLISPGGKVDFRINLLPFRTDQKYETYAVAAWGKRYRLGV